MVEGTALTIADSVFERLRDDLKSSEFPPGQRLKFDQVCKKYGVGLAPVREALCRLVGLGLVVQIGQKGFRAADASEDDLAHLVANRHFLEERALKAAIAIGGESWENGIVVAFHRLTAASKGKPLSTQQRSSWEKLHTEFHCALVAGCGSPWLLHAWRAAFDQCERYRRLSMESGHWIAAQKSDHSALVEAALSRNAAKAIKILNRHVGLSAEFFVRNLRSV
jgi:GntR family carbon starvation induced transcriptional regulator